MKNMELRTKGQLPLRLNEKEYVITHKKRKRENTTSQKTLPVTSKKCKKNRKVDTFCWVCHKFCKGKVCSDCPRIYHSQCLKGLKSFTEQNICPECQMESVEGQEKIDPCKRLKELLMYAIDKTFSLRNIKDLFFNWPENDSKQVLCNKIDAEILCEKLKADSYKSPIEFFSDFKWILHNCSIVYGDKSEITQCASQLVKKLKEELLNLEACPDCYFYQNSNEVDEADYFYKICTKPHDVIFAKVKGFTFWPAKLLKVMKSGSAYVAFFGTHEMSCVPANMWFPLKGNPEKLSAQQLQYSVGITELIGYFENLKSPSSITDKKLKTTLKCDKEIQASINLPEQEILPDFLSGFSAFTALMNELNLNSLSKLNEVDCKPNITDIPCFSEHIPEPSDSINHLAISDPVSVSMTFSEDSLCFNEMEIEELLAIPNPSIETQKQCKSGQFTESNLSDAMPEPFTATQKQHKSGQFTESNPSDAMPEPFTDCCSTTSTLNQVNMLCNIVKETILNNFSPEASDKEPLPATVEKNKTFEEAKTVDEWGSKADAKECEPTAVNMDFSDKTQFASLLEPQLNLFLQENSKKIVDKVVIKLLDALYETLPSVICKMKKPKSDKTLEKNKLSNGK